MRFRRKIKPKKLVLETTTRCNARCTYCGNKDVPKMDMPLDLYKAIIDAAPFVERIDPLSRGEPLLYPHIVEAVEYAKQAGKKVVMHTNGSLMNGEMALKLMRAGVDMIVFSIDDSVKEYYEQVRQGLDFDLVRKNVEITKYLRNFHRFDTEIRVRICVNYRSRDRLAEIIHYWEKRVDVVTSAFEQDIFVDSEIKISPFAYTFEPIDCGEIYKSMAIRPDGTVAICCTDWYDNFVIGKVDINVTKKELIDIFNNDIMTSYRKALRSGRKIPVVCIACKGRN